MSKDKKEEDKTAADHLDDGYRLAIKHLANYSGIGITVEQAVIELTKVVDQ